MAKKLFFIDDDDVFFYLIERACQDIESVEKLYYAESGEEALDKIDSWLKGEDELPDLMFVDINMPGMDGFEFLDEFKALREKVAELKKIVPVVMLTSSQNELDRKKAMSIGVVDNYVVKPADMQGMGKLVQEFTD